jgi:sec-independent protein translocase protein TatA
LDANAGMSFASAAAPRLRCLKRTMRPAHRTTGAGFVARRSEMDLGWQELLIILVVVMIVFGAGKLPEVAKSLGQGVKAFKQEAEGPDGILGTGSTAATSTTAGPAATTGAPVERQVRAEDI